RDQPASAQRVSSAPRRVPRQAGIVVAELLHSLRGRRADRSPEAVCSSSGAPKVVLAIALPSPGGPPPASRGGGLRTAVKATQKPYRYRRSDGRTSNSYRFGLRRGRGSHNRIDPKLVDAIAFVALDTRRVAYLWVSDLIRPDGNVSGIAELCDESDRRRGGSRTVQNRAHLSPVTGQPSVRACFRCGTERPATVEHFPPNKSGSGVLGVCRPCIRRSDLANRRARKGATA